MRGGAAIAVGAEIRVPPGGWLRLARRGAHLRLGRGRVLLECADTRLETGRLTLVAARIGPARAVLATPQAALTATRAGSQVEVAVGRRTRIWVHSGVGRVLSSAAAAPLEALAATPWS